MRDDPDYSFRRCNCFPQFPELPMGHADAGAFPDKWKPFIREVTKETPENMEMTHMHHPCQRNRLPDFATERCPAVDKLDVTVGGQSIQESR